MGTNFACFFIIHASSIRSLSPLACHECYKPYESIISVQFTGKCCHCPGYSYRH